MEKSRHAMELLTPAEVAKTLRVSRMTVYRMMHSGDLPSMQFGRSFRIPTEAVQTYISEHMSVPGTVKER